MSSATEQTSKENASVETTSYEDAYRGGEGFGSAVLRAILSKFFECEVPATIADTLWYNYAYSTRSFKKLMKDIPKDWIPKFREHRSGLFPSQFQPYAPPAMREPVSNYKKRKLSRSIAAHESSDNTREETTVEGSSALENDSLEVNRITEIDQFLASLAEEESTISRPTAPMESTSNSDHLNRLTGTATAPKIDHTMLKTQIKQLEVDVGPRVKSFKRQIDELEFKYKVEIAELRSELARITNPKYQKVKHSA